MRLNTKNIVGSLQGVIEDLEALQGESASDPNPSKNSARNADLSRELLRIAHELDYSRVEVMEIYHTFRGERAARRR